MPTRNINLTPEQDAFVAELLEAGEYQNASEAIRDAVRLLQLKRGEFVEIDEADLVHNLRI